MSIIQDIDDISIRTASPSDSPALRLLAQRDSSTAPAGDVLVASAGGSIRAAIEVETGAVIADPFQRTTELIALLRARREQIHGARRAPLRILARTPFADRERAAA